MLYNFIVFLGFLIYLPKIFLKIFKQKNFHYPFSARLGFTLPNVVKTNREVYWLHANSLGETKAALTFAEYLKDNLKNPYIVFSSVTDTGKEIAEKSKLVDLSIYMPLDFSFTMKKLLTRINPKALFVVETDFWYQLLKQAKNHKTKVFLVSGKISEKSAKRYLKIPFFTKRLFSFFDHFCLQNKEYEEAFLKLGVDPKKISVTGNVKFSEKFKIFQDKELQGFRNILKISPQDKVITLASTHTPEEMLLLESIDMKKYKVLIAPRHPYRFNEVFSEIAKKYDVKRLSKPSTIKKNTPIILIDAIGIVPMLYQLSHLAIVGGSFVDNVGGHNVLEPLILNTPTIFGPSMYGQKDLKIMALKTSICRQVEIDDLPLTIETLIGKTLKQPLVFTEILKNTYKIIQSKLST